MKSVQHKHQTVLYVGNDERVVEAIEAAIRSRLCAQAGCKICVACRLISERQQCAVMWLKRPERWYRRADVMPLFHRAQFKRTENEPFFFVIERIDLMTEAAANSMLKLLEEPPAGCHFLLGAPREHAVLETLRSRCLIIPCAGQASSSWPNLYAVFTASPDPARFMSLLENRSSEAHQLSEAELLDFIDHVYIFWSKQVREMRSTELLCRIRALETAKCHRPMPGSTLLCLKNLFVQLFFGKAQLHRRTLPGKRRLLTGRFIPRLCNE